MEIFLIRHTRPNIEEGTIYGRLDVNLADSFEEELKTIQEKVPKSFDAVFSSPSLRCILLAQHLNGNSLKSDERLMEYNFGNWEGKKWVDINKNILYLWTKDYLEAAPPDGETMIEMFHRINDFWKDLLHQNHKNVAIVTHGGVIRMFWNIIENVPLNEIFDVKCAFGEVLRFDKTASKINYVC